MLLALAVFPMAARPDSSKAIAAPSAATSVGATNFVIPTDPTDGNIAQVTSEMLQAWQYTRHPFDKEIANKFLDRYLDSLDYYHLNFLQSDVHEFDAYRTNLPELFHKRDLTPCWTIFSRFMQRANERIDYVTNYLATAKLDFSGDDRFTPDRHLLPYAKDQDELHEFWRQSARCEYLDEKLKSPDVRYETKLKFDNAGHAEADLARDKAHALTLDFLPQKLFAKDGHELASVEVSDNRSNAVVRLEWSVDKDKKSTNTIYSQKGDEVGSIATHFVATLRTNAAEPESTNRIYDTNMAVVIELKQKNVAEVLKTLTNHYVQMVKNYQELDSDRVFEIYMNSLAHAYDPHSDYMGHLQAENFAIQMKLSLFGIGALLGSEDGYCKISELKEGPARRSGKIKENDRIVAVAQSNAEPVNVVGMPLDKVVQLIRGPKGSKVTLTIIPADAADSSTRKIVALVRDEIKLDESAAKARLYEVPAPSGNPMRLGLIDLPSFYANTDSGEMASATNRTSSTTSADVACLIKRLKKEHVDGIILDLRRNGGGYLEEAIKLTGLFITKDPVVQTKDFNGDIVADSDPDPSCLYDGPLVVLTSRFSASASEILAGALQDYGRAVIVGDKSTFGKGTVQTVQMLAPIMEQQRMRLAFDPGQLKVTIKKFYRAGGASTQLKGVVSDVELPSVWSYADVVESSLPNAMSWDEVTSADFDYLDRVKPYLPELQKRSRQRVEADPEYAFIRERIERYKKEMADKSVSLNEQKRIADQKEITAENDALKRERAAHKPPQDKVYEITLKNVDMAALYPPLVKPNSNLPSHDDEFDIDDETGAHDETGEIDPELEETKRILMDYIGMSGRAAAISRADGSPIITPEVAPQPARNAQADRIEH